MVILKASIKQLRKEMAKRRTNSEMQSIARKIAVDTRPY